MEVVAGGLFLATINERLIEFFIGTPLDKNMPNLNRWWLMYVALATGFALAWFSGTNLFEAVIANDMLGRVLSGVLVGGGSNLIHDIVGSFEPEPEPEPTS